MNNSDNKISTITGRYSYLSNPCLTEPCLPGLAGAVSFNNKNYFLTIDGSWILDDHSWDKYTPHPNDIVTITGYIKKNKDIKGNIYFTIETLSLMQAK